MTNDHVGAGAIGRDEPSRVRDRRSWLERQPALVRYALAIVLNLAFLAAAAVGLYALFQVGAATRTGRTEEARIERDIEDRGPRRPESGSGARGDNRADPIASRPAEPGEETAGEPGAASAEPELPGRAWAEAGSLAAALQAELDCSTFAIHPGEGGQPYIDGEVSRRADRDMASQRLAAVLGEQFDVRLGLGCTRELGGGYVALTDSTDAARLLGAADITQAVRVVLPPREMCSALGVVVDAHRPLRERLEAAGVAGVWVVDAAELMHCAGVDRAWSVEPPAEDATAAVILYRGDILLAAASDRAAPAPAAEAERVVAAVSSAAVETPREEEDEGPPPPTPRPAPEPPPRPAAEEREAAAAISEAETEELAETAFRAAPRAVSPVSGPTPTLPDGVGVLAEALSVTVQFSVGRTGRARDFVVVSADTYSAPVIAAAVRVVEDSTFPPPGDGDGEFYRGVYVVRFAPRAGAALGAPAVSARVAAEAVEDDPFALETSPPEAASASGVPDARLSIPGPATPPPPAAAAAALEAAPVWVRPLTAEDFDALYPERALRLNQDGSVDLACIIVDGGRLDCEVLRQSPPGWRFGRAALGLSRRLLAAPRLSDGAPSLGHAFTLPFDFQAAPDGAPQ